MENKIEIRNMNLHYGDFHALHDINLDIKENEITAARIIMSGRMAGVPADSIRERLRDSYV